MSDDITAKAGEQTTEQAATEVKAFEAITSQEDFDARIQKRIARERSNFADYDDLKSKADRLAEIEAANQTEAEKVQARLDAAEKRASDLERDNAELATAKLRSDIAATKGIPTALLKGNTQEELEEEADALIEFRGEQKSAGPSTSAIARTNATPKTDDYDTAIADARAARNFPLAITLQQRKSAELAERKD